MTPPSQLESVVGVTKLAVAMDHLRNNRIEYLILLLLSHMVGFTSIALDKAQGLC